MIERIIFFTISLVLFLLIFFKMVRKNDTNYLYILILEAIGITIGFIFLIMRIKLNVVLMIFTYIISIVIPIILIIIERNGISLTEGIYILISKYFLRRKDNEMAKKFLMKLIEKCPNSYYAHKELAKIYEMEENLQLALEEYIRTINLKPRK